MLCSHINFTIDIDGSISAQITWPDIDSPKFQKKMVNNLRRFLINLQSGKENAIISEAVIKYGKKTGESKIVKRVLNLEHQKEPNDPIILPEEINI